MANQNTQQGRNGADNGYRGNAGNTGNLRGDYDRDRDFASRQSHGDDRDDERRDDDRYALSPDRQQDNQGGGWGRDRDREAYDRTNFGPTYSGSGSGRGQQMGNHPDDDRGYGRSYDHERLGQRQPGPNYNQRGSGSNQDYGQGYQGYGQNQASGQRSSRGSGDGAQSDEGRVTYGRQGENLGFRESTGYGRERDDNDRFGRRDDYQSMQGQGSRQGGRGQSGYGSGYQSERSNYGQPSGNYGQLRGGSTGGGGGDQEERFGDWGNNDQPGRGGMMRDPGSAYGASGGSWNQTGQGGRFGQSSDRGMRNQNYGVGGRDSERADQQQRSFRGVGPQGYNRSDSRIQEDVSDCFTDDHQLDAANIHVKVQNGEVTLTGTVNDRTMKYHAEELAERITGVKEVDNQIRVQKQQQHQGGQRTAGSSYGNDDHGSSTGTQHLGSSATGKTTDDKSKAKPSA